MKKVYLVTHGSYSEYEVDAVLSSRELAQEYCDTFNKASGHEEECIEEFELDVPKDRWFHTSVSMHRDGNLRCITKGSGGCAYANVGYSSGFQGYSTWMPAPTHRVLNWDVPTLDRERAIKVVNEKRTQILAADCWDDDGKTRLLFGMKDELTEVTGAKRPD